MCPIFSTSGRNRRLPAAQSGCAARRILRPMTSASQFVVLSKEEMLAHADLSPRTNQAFPLVGLVLAIGE